MGYTIWPDGPTGDSLSRVNDERYRQERLKAEGKFKKTCADDMPNAERLAVLAEEFGEVARHVCEELISADRLDKKKLYKELIEVAAVAVAWAESLDPNYQVSR